MPADSDRFASWVQDLLSTVPNCSGDKISGHSVKATPLSWMGKDGTEFDTQSLLGHHVLVERSSALTYARDTQVAPVRKFEALLGDVRKGVSFLTLLDKATSCRRLPEAPQSRRKASFWGADETMVLSLLMKPTGCRLRASC